MNNQQDELHKYALMLVAMVVALVVAGVVGLGIAKSQRQGPAPVMMAQATGATGPVFGEPVNVHFEPGSASLSPQATEVLGQVALLARSNAGSTVLISGFHDASGDMARNAEAAQARMLAVQHALEAEGVSSGSMQLSKPLPAHGAGHSRGERVEVILQ
jgi:outer membrane protein OmpA-like peptidoglycan-associated protein